MSGKSKIVLLGVLAALILLPLFVQTGGARAVYLKAMFRDFGTDSITSDGKGPYQNASNVTVQFSEGGELQFIIGERAARRINFTFDAANLLSAGPCAACAEEVPALPDEPTTYVSFRTTISASHKGPQLNFLTMTPGQIAPVRLAVYFDTKERTVFRLRYFNYIDPEEYCAAGGPVMVKAIDQNGDLKVDRWVLYPVPDTDDRALFLRETKGIGHDWLQCSFGYYKMPFELILDRK